MFDLRHCLQLDYDNVCCRCLLDVLVDSGVVHYFPSPLLSKCNLDDAGAMMSVNLETHKLHYTKALSQFHVQYLKLCRQRMKNLGR